MLFTTGGSTNSASASNLFRQLKPALDKDASGTVSREELVAARQSAPPGELPNGADSMVDYLLSNYDSFIDPESGEDGISENGLDAEQVQQQEEQKKAEAEAQAAREQQEKQDRENAERVKAEQDKLLMRGQSKELINTDNQASSLFKKAFKQLTGEDASAEDVQKWERSSDQPTTSLDKARHDVIAVRPELKDQQSTGLDSKLQQDRVDTIKASLNPFSLGSVAGDRLAKEYASRGGSVQSVINEALNQFA